MVTHKRFSLVDMLHRFYCMVYRAYTYKLYLCHNYQQNANKHGNMETWKHGNCFTTKLRALQ